MVGFSWDGSFVAGSSDEGNGIEIVSLCFRLRLGFLGWTKIYTPASFYKAGA